MLCTVPLATGNVWWRCSSQSAATSAVYAAVLWWLPAAATCTASSNTAMATTGSPSYCFYKPHFYTAIPELFVFSYCWFFALRADLANLSSNKDSQTSTIGIHSINNRHCVILTNWEFILCIPCAIREGTNLQEATSSRPSSNPTSLRPAISSRHSQSLATSNLPRDRMHTLRHRPSGTDNLTQLEETRMCIIMDFGSFFAT